MKTSPFLLFLALPTLATAAPIWKLDFENMSAGDPPTIQGTATPGIANKAPQKLVNEKSENGVNVVSNFSANGITLTGNSLVLTKSVIGDQEVTLIGNATDYTAWTDYQLSFDLLADNRNLGQPLNIRLTTSNNNTNVASLVFGMDGSIILGSNLSTTSTLTFTEVWDPSKLNEVVVQIDSSTKKLSAYVGGTLAGTLSLDLALEASNPLGVGRVRIRNNSTNALYAYGVALDNFTTSTTLSPIPEPSSVALLAFLGGAGYLLRYKRKRQSA